MVRCGFLREEPVMVNGTPVSPLEFCTALLTSQQQFWYRKDERDVGYIRVEARGRKNAHFQQAAAAFALLAGNPHNVGPPFSAQPAAPAGLEPQRHLGDGVALPRFFLLTPETLKIIQDQWVQQFFQLVHVHA